MKIENNELALVLTNDLINSSSDHIYTGKYMVGKYQLTDMFIIEYMRLIHGIDIPDSWVSSGFTNMSNINTRKVMYMESCDIILKVTMNEIRNVVKSPPVNVRIYRDGKKINKIEIMEDCN